MNKIEMSISFPFTVLVVLVKKIRSLFCPFMQIKKQPGGLLLGGREVKEMKFLNVNMKKVIYINFLVCFMLCTYYNVKICRNSDEKLNYLLTIHLKVE